MKLSSVCVLLLLVVVMLSPLGAWATAPAADNVGAAELKLVTSLLTGYLGYALGLVVAVMGAYTFATGNAKGGITLVVLGVIITLLPALYNATRALVCPAVSALFGASC